MVFRWSSATHWLTGESPQPFELVEHNEEVHVTPTGRIQHFIYCHCVTPH
jgi:hypothetical protein